MLGSEGGIGVVTRGTMRVARLPERQMFVGYFLPHWEEGEKATRALAERRIVPLRRMEAETAMVEFVVASRRQAARDAAIAGPAIADE